MSRVVQIHKGRLNNIMDEAEHLAGTMTKIANECREVLEQGGQLHAQPQVAFATGSLARLIKDWGVVEQLQQDGVSQRRKTT